MGAARRPFGNAPPAEFTAAGRSLRALAEMLLRTEGGEEELARAREALDAIQRRLEPYAHPAEGGASARRTYYVEGRALGAHNPLAPRLEVAHADGVTRGTVAFGLLHEGPPGFAHGGFVAYVFDAILGHHNVAAGLPGMTGSLRVRYHRPTPLGVELVVEARSGRVSERKKLARAELRQGDALLAEAEGLFIVPRAGFEAHMQRAEQQAGRSRQAR